MEKFNVKNGLSVGIDKITIIDSVANLSAAAITVIDQYTLPLVDGSPNQMIVTDGSGQLSFADQSAGGGSDISSLTANWESTYTTVQTNSSSWSTGLSGISYNRWAFTGNPPVSSFNIPGATSEVEESYRVTIDALIQDTISYTVSDEYIIFTEAPPLDSQIVIIESVAITGTGTGGGTTSTASAEPDDSNLIIGLSLFL